MASHLSGRGVGQNSEGGVAAQGRRGQMGATCADVSRPDCGNQTSSGRSESSGTRKMAGAAWNCRFPRKSQGQGLYPAASNRVGQAGAEREQE